MDATQGSYLVILSTLSVSWDFKYLNIPWQEFLQQNYLSAVNLALNLLASFNAPWKRQLTMNLYSNLHNIYNFT